MSKKNKNRTKDLWDMNADEQREYFEAYTKQVEAQHDAEVKAAKEAEENAKRKQLEEKKAINTAYGEKIKSGSLYGEIRNDDRNDDSENHRIDLTSLINDKSNSKNKIEASSILDVVNKKDIRKQEFDFMDDAADLISAHWEERNKGIFEEEADEPEVSEEEPEEESCDNSEYHNDDVEVDNKSNQLISISKIDESYVINDGVNSYSFSKKTPTKFKNKFGKINDLMTTVDPDNLGGMIQNIYYAIISQMTPSFCSHSDKFYKNPTLVRLFNDGNPNYLTPFNKYVFIYDNTTENILGYRVSSSLISIFNEIADEYEADELSDYILYLYYIYESICIMTDEIYDRNDMIENCTSDPYRNAKYLIFLDYDIKAYPNTNTDVFDTMGDYFHVLNQDAIIHTIENDFYEVIEEHETDAEDYVPEVNTEEKVDSPEINKPEPKPTVYTKLKTGEEVVKYFDTEPAGMVDDFDIPGAERIIYPRENHSQKPSDTKSLDKVMNEVNKSKDETVSTVIPSNTQNIIKPSGGGLPTDFPVFPG